MSAYVLKRTLSDAHSSTINTLAFSPTGLYLASGADDNTVIIWNIPDGQFIFRLKFGSPVHVVIWHPNRSETLILGCRDGSLLEASNFRLVTVANPICPNLYWLLAHSVIIGANISTSEQLALFIAWLTTLCGDTWRLGTAMRYISLKKFWPRIIQEVEVAFFKYDIGWFGC